MPKRRRKTAKRPAFTFTLILGGESGLSTELEEALFEAGCDDALLGARDGVLFLDFEREAPSLAEAILSAMASVKRARLGGWVARVEPDDLVTASEMARRLGRSRESVRKLVQGERGPGGFPPPIANLGRRSPIWRWAEVTRWFREHHEGSDQNRELVEQATVIAMFNSALELRRTIREPAVVNRLWEVAGGLRRAPLRIVPSKRTKPGSRGSRSRK